MENHNYFALAIPFFIAGMLIELVYQWKSKRALYKFDDLITNLSCGIGQQVIDIFLKVLILGIYSAVYQHARLWTIPGNVVTWSLLFVLIDFCFYWFHRFAHQINLLWGTHIVHHQSEEFNFSVALRQSWFDNLFNIIFYLPLAFLGFDTLSFFVLFSFNTIYQLIIHTKLIGKLGVLEYFLNTPSHHRVHHGKNEAYIDKNYGGVFIVWDRMFGTFEPELETVEYGITRPIPSFNPLTLNFSYWMDLFKDLAHINSFSKKVHYLFSKPGTIPSDDLTNPNLGEMKFMHSPTKLNSLSLSVRMFTYIGIHFLLILFQFIVFLDYKIRYNTLEKITLSLYILGTLTIIGALLTLKKSFLKLEIVRSGIALIVWIMLFNVFDSYNNILIILFFILHLISLKLLGKQ